jgi:hypothetical protein
MCPSKIIKVGADWVRPHIRRMAAIRALRNLLMRNPVSRRMAIGVSLNPRRRQPQTYRRNLPLRQELS